MQMRSATLLTVFIGLFLLGGINARATGPTAYRKKIPVAYENEILTALSYFPELQKVPVKFKIGKSYAALKTRPSFISMIMPRGFRTYVIIISNKTIPALSPITFQNMPAAARIGVIGHELSHVVDFHNKSTWQSLRVAAHHVSIRYMDSLEYHTDKICIDHGLGRNLYAWSHFVRETLHTTNYRGADYVFRGDMHCERYMNPDTILKYMDKIAAANDMGKTDKSPVLQ